MTVKFSITLILAILITALAARSARAGPVLRLAIVVDHLAETFQQHEAQLYAETGANLTITIRPWDTFVKDLDTDLKSQSLLFDAFIFSPQWLIDLVECSICVEPIRRLAPLNEYVASDTAIDWLDIGAFFRDFSAVYDNTVYAVPLDGDVFYMHVRKDILDRYGLPVPETWQEYRSVSAALHGKDMNGDGVPDFGTCTGYGKNVIYWWMWAIYSNYIQVNGTADGAWFDAQTMIPLIKNEGFVEAATLYKDLLEFAPPNALEIHATETRDLFLQGRCALSFDFADLFGGMMKTPFNGSYLLAPTPGTLHVVDRTTGKLVKCDKTVCPNGSPSSRVPGDWINRAPYAAFGGWAGGISAFISKEKKDIAYKYFSIMSRPANSIKDIVTGKGLDPYRSSQLDPNKWLSAGFDLAYVTRNLPNFAKSINSRNLVLDLRVRANSDYQRELLDPQLKAWVFSTSSLPDAQDAIFASWEALTEKYGRLQQLQTYRATIGAPRLLPCSESSWNYTVSDCSNSTEMDVIVTYDWIQPKLCSGGVELPAPFILRRCFFVNTGSSVGIGLTVVAATIICFFISLGALVFLRREDAPIRKSSWVFSIIIIVGGAMMNAAIFASIGVPSLGTCVINIWILSLGYVFMFGGFITKMWRIDRIMNGSIKDSGIKLTDVDLAKILGILLVVDMALLCAWTWVGDGRDGKIPSGTYTTVSISSVTARLRICSGGNVVTIALLFVYKCLMLLYGAYLGFRTKDAPGEFSEQRFTATAILIVMFSGAVIVPIVYTVDSSSVLIASLGILFSSVLPVCVYTIPKLLHSYGVASFGSKSFSSHLAASQLPTSSSYETSTVQQDPYTRNFRSDIATQGSYVDSSILDGEEPPR